MAYCKQCCSIFPEDPNRKECPVCGSIGFRPTSKRYVALKEITEYPFTDDGDTDQMIKRTVTEVIGSTETELTLDDAYDICWNIIRSTLAMCISSDDYIEVGM